MSLPTQLVIPFSKLTADQCRVIAERANAAMAALEKANVGRVLRSRLTEAITRLNQIADRGTYGQTPAERQLDVQTISVAVDFYQIGTVLPPTIPEHIAVELARALEGKLGVSSGPRVAEQFLSQFWFALVLARAGISPGVPRTQPSKANPDYLVSVDTMDCAVEVKRPESPRSAPDLMDHAADQIRDFGKPGYIAMDLTDLIFQPEQAVAYTDQPGLLLKLLKGLFRAYSNKLEGRVRTYTRSDKYAKVIGMALFARAHFWEQPDLSQPKGKYLFSASTFEKACNGLVVDQATRLNHLILSGAQDVAGGGARKL